jgi:hypothetical protein
MTYGGRVSLVKGFATKRERQVEGSGAETIYHTWVDFHLTHPFFLLFLLRAM